MPTRTFAANRSSLFAGGSTNLGGGADQHLPVGAWSGYQFRSAIRFALDYAGVRRITSANLRIATSSQVHVGFSSAPDVLVQRCTADWSANSSSGSSDGGSGWSTSPTVYPGPTATSTGQASKRVTTAQSTWVDIDVTAIARAWAPSSVEGGGSAANYGVILKPAASSDVTEFVSMRAAGSNPTLTITYETDTPPPAPTVTGPTGTVTTLRPTLTATAVDPDGDPLEMGDVEVRKAGTVVYSSVGFAAAGASSLSHVPTADLPAGALGVRFRARAAGVYGAWSGDAPFTVDRPPIMGAWSAPAATVSGTRRPVHTVAWSDPDGDAGEAYDLEVYADGGGGAPASGAAPVYARAGVTTGLAAGTISHTPAADLPGGALVARARVQTAGVSSAWSTWRAYTVVLTVPTISWQWPEYDGGWARVRTSEMGSSTYPPGDVDNLAIQGASITYAPPSGTTIASSSTIKVEVEDPGIGGPAAGTVIVNSGFGAIAAGGAYTWAFRPRSSLAGWLAGTLKITFTINAANGGTVTEVRRARFALGEWYGAIALGDSVTGLAVTPVAKIDDAQLWVRAQSSPSAPVAGQVWTPNVATAAAALPATNAYLGIYERISRRADDSQVLVNPSFEAGQAPWGPNFTPSPPSMVAVIPAADAPDGGKVLQIVGNGSLGYPAVLQTPDFARLIPGATYRLSGWIKRGGGGTQACAITLRKRDAAGVIVGADLIAVQSAVQGVWTYGEVWYQIPTDGSVAQLNVYCTHQNVPTSAMWAWFDRVYLEGPVLGDQGLERLTLSWSSLG